MVIELELKMEVYLLKKLLDKNVFIEFMKKVIVKIIIFHIFGFFNYMEEYYSSCFSEQDFSEESSYNSTNDIRIEIDDFEQ